MTKSQIKLLRQASKLLHKEFDKSRCKDKQPPCPQCWIDRIIEDFDGVIEYVDESKWKKIVPTTTMSRNRDELNK